MTSDSDLLSRAARGEEAAAEALLERYWGLAYRVALRLTQDGALAEDAAQQAFLKAFAAPERFDASRSFRPWFLTLAANEARMISRSRRRRQTHEERAPQPAPADAVTQADLREAIRVHLSSLEDRLRVPLTLHYLDGLTQAEVAEVLSCPKSTAATRIRDGLAQLRVRIPAPVLALAIVPLTALLSEAGQAESIPPAPSAASLLPPATSALAPGIVATLVKALAALAFVAAATLGIALVLGEEEAEPEQAPSPRVALSSPSRTVPPPAPAGSEAAVPSGQAQDRAATPEEARPPRPESDSPSERSARRPARAGITGRVTFQGRRPPQGLKLEVSAQLAPAMAAGSKVDLDAEGELALGLLERVLRQQPYALRVTPAARAALAGQTVWFRLREISLCNVIRLVFLQLDGLAAYRVRDGEVLVGLPSELGPSQFEAPVASDGTFAIAGLETRTQDQWELRLVGGAIDSEEEGSFSSMDKLSVRSGGVAAPADQVVLDSPLEIDVPEVRVDELVLDHQTGRPLVGARVVSQGRSIATSDAEGRVRFVWPWPHEVHVQCEGYASERAAMPGYSNWPLRLEPTRTLSGVVLTEAGKPVPDATVWAPPPRLSAEVLAHSRSAEQPSTLLPEPTETTTDAEGRYELMIPARFGRPSHVEARGEDGESVLLGYLPLPATGAKLPPIVLRGTRELEGRVLDPNGQPVSGARVTFLAGRSDPGERPWVSTLALGDFDEDADDGAADEDADADDEAADDEDADDEDADDEDADDEDADDEDADDEEWSESPTDESSFDVSWDVARTDSEGKFKLPLAPAKGLWLRVEFEGRSQDFEVGSKAPLELRLSHASERETRILVRGDRGTEVRFEVRAYPAGSLTISEPRPAHALGAGLASELRRTQPLWQRRARSARPLATSRRADNRLYLSPGHYDLSVRPDGARGVGQVFPRQRLPGGGGSVTLELSARTGSVSLAGVLPLQKEDRILTLVDARGAWVAPPDARGWLTDELSLPPGRYTLRAACSGFEPSEVSLKVEGPTSPSRPSSSSPREGGGSKSTSQGRATRGWRFRSSSSATRPSRSSASCLGPKPA